jgi:CBS domain-containing protein
MKAGELCVRDVVTAESNETVRDAARRMADLGVGDLVVVITRGSGNPRPVGIVTDRDLVVQVLARPECDPATTLLRDLLRHVELVVASEDDDVEHVLAKMREHTIRRIPIIDTKGGLQGMLSIDDLLGWMRDQLADATRLLERQGQGPLSRAPRRADHPR